MENYEVNFVLAGIAENVKKKCEAAGIDTKYFGVTTWMSEDFQLSADWHFTTTLEDGNLYIDLLDDKNGSNEVILEYTLDEFGIELTEDQKMIFLEFEPKLAVIRRIQHVQNAVDHLKEIVRS